MGKNRQRPGRHRGTLGALRLVRETTANVSSDDPAEGAACASPKNVHGFMQPYATREEIETFWILALNTQHRVIFNSPIVITRGILSGSPVHPREVFRAAIAAGAAAVVMVHNHPSGDPTPSPDDRAVTQQLVAAGRLLDLPVLDHVIIGRTSYTSFAELGLVYRSVA